MAGRSGEGAAWERREGELGKRTEGGSRRERIGRRVNEERHDERGQIKIGWRLASLSVWNRIRR